MLDIYTLFYNNLFNYVYMFCKIYKYIYIMLCNNFDLLLNDCIQCVIQHLDMLNVISLSETNINLNKICNKFESIKNHIRNLGFNPYNYFPYYEDGIEKNIKQYMNYEKNYSVYNEKFSSLELQNVIHSNKNFIGKDKIYSVSLLDGRLNFLFSNYKYKTLNFILKTDKLLVGPTFEYYEIVFNDYILQTTFYDELPILCKHHNINNILNNYTIKNGVYKYKIPIVIGMEYIPSKFEIKKITIKIPNDIIIYDTYIKCDKFNAKIRSSTDIYKYIITKSNGIFKFVTGQNTIKLGSIVYPIKLYFYFDNMTDMNMQPFKNLCLTFNGININYKYNHIKKDIYNNKYHYCLNFIDDSVNVFDNLDRISKYKIDCPFNISFDNCNVKLNTHIVFYTLCYNYLMVGNGIGSFMYSN